MVKSKFILNFSLNLAQHITAEKRQALDELPCFVGATTHELIREAEAKLSNKRKVGDRFTAMLVIVGQRYLDHPDLQVPRTERNAMAYHAQ